MKKERTIESKIYEYIEFGADTDYRGNIPKGCTLTWADYCSIEDLVSDTIALKNGILSKKMEEIFYSKIASFESNLSREELINLLLSV